MSQSVSENFLQYELKVLYPPEEQRTLVLDSRGIIVGRGEESQLQFEDEWISRSHCKIWLEENTIWLEDMNSTNGTFLDGQLIDKQNILPGSKVQLGKVVLTVECNAPQSKEIAFPQVKSDESIDKVEGIDSELFQIESKNEQNNGEPISLQFNSHIGDSFADEPQTVEDNEIEAEFELETTGQEENLSQNQELAQALNYWVQQLDSPLNVALFRICLINLDDFAKNPGPAAVRFLNLEMDELLQTEKISDEWITEVQPGEFLFGVHTMNHEQANLFAMDLHQLISKQIFSYQGEILKVQLSVGVVLTRLADINWVDVLEQSSEALNLAIKSEKSHVLMNNG